MNLEFVTDAHQKLLRFYSRQSSYIKIALIRFEKALKFIALYLAVAGLFGFSCFIMEEGVQLLSFAQFSASDNKQYALMKRNLDYMEQINKSLKFMNTWFLWMLPPQQAGYRHYAAATDRYIETLRAEVLANDPSVYVGEQVTLRFQFDSYEKKHNNLWVAKNRRVKILLDAPPGGKVIEIEGILKPDPDIAGGVILEKPF